MKYSGLYRFQTRVYCAIYYGQILTKCLKDGAQTNEE
jgi:hypothetical protein